MITRFYLNGLEINEPINYGELEIEIDNTGENITQNVTLTEFQFGVGDGRFANDGKNIIDNHRKQGLSGGVGITEGLPYKIVIDDLKGTQITIFDGYIDTGRATYSDGIITANAIEKANVDWLNSVADSFTFEYLFSIAAFSSSEFIAVPYCKSAKQNAFETLIAITTIYMLTLELIKTIKDVADAVTDSGNPFTTANGIIKVILMIVYIIILIISLLKIIIDTYNHLIQPVKYHLAMNVKRQLEIGCAHLGLTFKSSIFDAEFKDMVIMPEKYNIKEDNTGLLKNISGYFTANKNEQVGYYKGTFGDLLRDLKTMFNAKIYVDNDILYFERSNFNIGVTSYQIPNIDNGEFTLNIDDLKSNYLLKFETDIGDRNTIKEYKGTSYQAITTPIAVNEQNLVLLEGLKYVNIPFALGKRKTNLTNIERVLKVFFDAFGTVLNALADAINAIIGVINDLIEAINELIDKLSNIGINLDFDLPTIPLIEFPNILNLIANRIDMLKMEGDFVNVKKVLLVAETGDDKFNKLLEENESVLSARHLYQNYHYLNNFVPSANNPNGGQYIRKNIAKMPITFSNFVELRKTLTAYAPSGNLCEIEKLKFNPTKEIASISYKENQLYTNNLSIKFLEPDGQ